MIDHIPTPTPRSSYELFRWLFMEPLLLKKYSQSLTRGKAFTEFLRGYMWALLFAIAVGGATILTVILTRLPALIPSAFKPELNVALETGDTWYQQFSLFMTFSFQHSWLFFGGAFLLGIFILLTFSISHLLFPLRLNLSMGSAFALTLAGLLTCGLVMAPISGIPFAISRGLFIGLLMAFSFMLYGAVEIGPGRVFLLIMMLDAITFTIGFIAKLDWEVSAALAFSVTGIFILIFYRLFPFYPINILASFFTTDPLSRNPYRWDGVIFLPLPGFKGRLVKQVNRDTIKAFAFIDFLIKYRPLQKSLAMSLTHAATAATWINDNFSGNSLKKIPIISKDSPKFLPSEMWYKKLSEVREEKVAAEQQSNIGFKLDYQKRYLNRLRELEELTMKMESSHWNHYYAKALNTWTRQASEDRDKLKLTAGNQEPIAKNIYRAGDPLTPELDRGIFIGREDLRDQLQQKILSSPTLPMFLIHGQRRVGKTSLLKFLPEILGPRFKVVYMDLQPMGSIYEWLTGLQKTFDATLGISSPPIPEGLEKNWLKAWKLLQGHMEEAAQNEECKIILAFDEYEKLHYLLRKSQEEAANLLGALRSFSQHQNKVVFLFVGSALFAELKAPDWSTFFVQAIRLKVDYLDEAATYRLIKAAQLEYPPEVLTRIYFLTRGHPTLVQKICLEMVNLANSNHRKSMTLEDLETILENHIYVPENGVTEVFWGQFCKSGNIKASVRQIIAGETPGDFRATFALTQHGFLIKDKNRLQLRVPIFETWVQRFGSTT